MLVVDASVLLPLLVAELNSAKWVSPSFPQLRLIL